MHVSDYVVMLCYLAGVLLVGLIFTGRNKSASDMFAAGGQSPWWTSGLSAFMTMFSANTFVVWGGIAYKYGLVAVCINLMYGIAALLVGYFVAGKWKKLGLKTPAEFIQLRYGKAALHFYTWFMMTFRTVTTAGSLYALGAISVALMTDGESTPAVLNAAIIIFGIIVILYTMFGGLWAVLMTDVLQFIVLNLAVLFVVPLAFMKIGGMSNFIHQAPAGFFKPIGGEYTWFFLAGWCAIHFFMIGAEWAFVQRFICVPNARDARKSTYLFGLLYLVSPLFWLLPPMIWRIYSPIPAGASPSDIRLLAENAYILSCKAVLPPGMVGMMLAAMFSATASMVSAQLNVFSGVLTNDIYRPLQRITPSDARMVWAGRCFTILLGILLVIIAVLIPYLGGAEKVIVSITEIMSVSLLAPTVWGVFSRRVNSAAVWATAALGFSVGFIVRFGLEKDGFLTTIPAFSAPAGWVQANLSTVKTFTGVALPLIILSAVQCLSPRRIDAGFARLQQLEAKEKMLVSAGTIKASRLPAMVVAWSMGICGLMMAILAVVNLDSALIMGSFAAALFAITAAIAWFVSLDRRR